MTLRLFKKDFDAVREELYDMIATAEMERLATVVGAAQEVFSTCDRVPESFEAVRAVETEALRFADLKAPMSAVNALFRVTDGLKSGIIDNMKSCLCTEEKAPISPDFSAELEEVHNGYADALVDAALAGLQDELESVEGAFKNCDRLEDGFVLGAKAAQKVRAQVSPYLSAFKDSLPEDGEASSVKGLTELASKAGYDHACACLSENKPLIAPPPISEVTSPEETWLIRRDTKKALVSLGWSPKESEEAADAVIKAFPEMLSTDKTVPAAMRAKGLEKKK